MKKILLVLVLVMSVGSACKKEVSQIEVFKSNLIGVWHLDSSRVSNSSDWMDVSGANDIFCIDGNKIHPYKENYYVVDVNIISIPSGENDRQNVIVLIIDDVMIFNFEDGSGFKLWR